MDIKEIKVGDIFSEVSHYTVSKVNKDNMELKHHASQQVVTLSNNYISSLLQSAQSWSKEVEVGKEDKLWTAKKIADAAKKGTDVSNIKEGDIQQVGIRTVWENIHSAQVFTVGFYKADKPKTQKDYKAELSAQADKFAQELEDIANAKKGILAAAKKAIEQIQANPISPVIKGELRTLRGYKIQFTSRDGGYDCIDMNLPSTGKESNVRPVNINTIQFIIFNDVLYVLEGFDFKAYLKDNK